MEQAPVFSVIIPTYNRAEFITRTIDSVLNQTYKSFEIIIVDDGSTDNTENILQPFLKQYPNIFYFKKKNEERGAARNFGIMHAKGEYITFLDSDDFFYPYHLHVASNLIREKNSPEVFHLGFEVVRTDGSVVKKVDHLAGSLNIHIIRFGNVLSCNGIFIRRDIAEKNLFVEDRELAGSEDYELWLRLASQYEIVYSNTITSVITHHEGRSVLEMSQKNALINRVEKVLWHVMNNEAFQKKYSRYDNRIRAINYGYLAVYLALAHYRMEAIRYLVRAIKEDFKVVFSRNFLATIKHIFGLHIIPGRFRS